ncbi:MAG: hypothetical protein KGY74_09440 [Candidatus Cloacimonetes bacterium]|nr:hypothetical protein [Candidatus Cloacimonadota bacterium]
MEKNVERLRDNLNLITNNKYKESKNQYQERLINECFEIFYNCVINAEKISDDISLIISITAEAINISKNELVKLKLKEILQDWSYSIVDINKKDGIDKIIEDSIHNEKQKKKKKEIANKMQDILSQSIDDLRANSDPLKIFESYNQIMDLENEYKENRKILSFNNYLVKKREQDLNRTGDFLGYRLEKFKNLCHDIEGLQPGFYLLSAFSNVGKTAFICNLAIDAIQSNPDANIVYFSLDDSRNVVINRMLAILSGTPINRVQRDASPDIDRAYQFLADSNIDIVDSEEIQNITQLEKKIRITYKSNNNLIVFIDGLYNLDVESKSTMIRDFNIERANKIKKIADSYEIPIIMTGEILKSKDKGRPSLSDIMESGKYVYNSNLILMLYDKTEVKQDDKAEPELNIGLIYAKNKLSHFKGERDLIFRPTYSRFDEDEKLLQKSQLCNNEKGWEKT